MPEFLPDNLLLFELVGQDIVYIDFPDCCQFLGGWRGHYRHLSLLDFPAGIFLHLLDSGIREYTIEFEVLSAWLFAENAKGRNDGKEFVERRRSRCKVDPLDEYSLVMPCLPDNGSRGYGGEGGAACASGAPKLRVIVISAKVGHCDAPFLVHLEA